MRVPPQRRFILSLVSTGLIVSAAAGVDTPLQAQVPEPSGYQARRTLVLGAGQWYLDVHGLVAAARAELPLDRGGRWLFVPGVAYSHSTLGSSGARLDLFAPEALVHLQLGQGRVRPYVGGGAGVVLINMFHTFDPVVSFGTGLRADLTPSLGARLEVDARAFGQLDAGSVGWSLGLAQRF
jgi:hypothetical protein